MRVKLLAAMLIGPTLALVACPGGGSNPPPADFALKLASSSADAFQGAGGLLRVTLERKNSFAGAIVIGLQNPPEGVTASTMTLKTGTEAQFSVNLAPDVPLGALALVVVGTSGAQTATATLTLNVRAATASSQELIAQAFRAGRIDLGTSFVYRAYALFGDGRLPPEFVGSGSSEEDNELFLEIEQNRASLSPATLDLLRPYTVRPSDPASAWSAGTGALRALIEPFACDGASAGWATQTNGGNTVRVWVRCPGDQAGNGQATDDLVKVLSVADRVYGPMTVLMGPPIPDQTGDSAIDFYIVPPGIGVPRPNPDPMFDVQSNRGVAVSAPPYASSKASGYLMLPTWRVREDDYFMTVIHEFFHVLQFAHNAFIRGFWFKEASATWASFHFNRTTPIDPPKSRSLHHERFSGYQKSFESLLSMSNDHNYYAYIWPLFMEHRADASLIGQAWRRLEGAQTATQATDVLDGLLSFKTYFREFALRNLNDEFLPGDPLPRDKRYIGLEKDSFPDKQLRPRNRKNLNLTPGVDVSLTLAQPLEPLSAGYFKVDAAPDPKLKQVKFNLEGLRVSGLDVDAILKINGTWESKPRDLTGKTELKFCLEKPEEKLEEIWFILSNHQKAPGATVSPGLGVRGLEAPCQSSYSGMSSSIISDFAPSYKIDAQVEWVLQEALSTGTKLSFKAVGTVTFDALPSQNDCTLTISPSTQAVNAANSNTELIVDFSTSPPTYEGVGTTLWFATYTQVCPEGTQTFTWGAGGAWFQAKGATSPDGKEIKGPVTDSGQTFNFRFVRD
jgi:hypothetical protein